MEIDEQHNAALAKVAEMVGDAKFAMLTTLEKDGTLRSRPMATMQLDSEGNLWFFTSMSSPKKPTATKAMPNIASRQPCASSASASTAC